MRVVLGVVVLGFALAVLGAPVVQEEAHETALVTEEPNVAVEEAKGSTEKEGEQASEPAPGQSLVSSYGRSARSEVEGTMTKETDRLVKFDVTTEEVPSEEELGQLLFTPSTGVFTQTKTSKNSTVFSYTPRAEQTGGDPPTFAKFVSVQRINGNFNREKVGLKDASFNNAVRLPTALTRKGKDSTVVRMEETPDGEETQLYVAEAKCEVNGNKNRIHAKEEAVEVLILANLGGSGMIGGKRVEINRVDVSYNKTDGSAQEVVFQGGGFEEAPVCVAHIQGHEQGQENTYLQVVLSNVTKQGMTIHVVGDTNGESGGADAGTETVGYLCSEPGEVVLPDYTVTPFGPPNSEGVVETSRSGFAGFSWVAEAVIYGEAGPKIKFENTKRVLVQLVEESNPTGNIAFHPRRTSSPNDADAEIILESDDCGPPPKPGRVKQEQALLHSITIKNLP